MAERKKYIDVKIPILRDETRVLGTAEDLDGKTIKLDLTRKLRGKGLTVTFKIFNDEGNLIAIPGKLELVKSYIRRMMRKRTDYVEDSFKAKCGNITTTIKPFLITRKRVSRAVRKNLRNTAREFISEYIKEREYNEICDELLEGVLQKAMLPKLKKVYPLSFCDLRVFETKDFDKIDLKKIVKKPSEENGEEEVVEEENVENVEEDTQEVPKTEEKEKKVVEEEDD